MFSGSSYQECLKLLPANKARTALLQTWPKQPEIVDFAWFLEFNQKL
jgi:hypothetical protein